jgi:1,4-dihydroxy-2-naphthoyl-CoA synthase
MIRWQCCGSGTIDTGSDIRISLDSGSGSSPYLAKYFNEKFAQKIPFKCLKQQAALLPRNLTSNFLF